MSMGDDEWLDAVMREEAKQEPQQKMKVRVPDSFYASERDPVDLDKFIESNLQDRYNGVSRGQVEDLAADVDVMREVFTRFLTLLVEDGSMGLAQLQKVLGTEKIERGSS